MLDIVYAQATDTGRVRPHNEDSAAAFIPRSRQEARAKGWMFAVADGVGGRDLGEVASAKAVEVIVSGFSEAPEQTSLEPLLMRLIQHANAAIHDDGLSTQRRGRHMATTVVCCAFRHDQAVIAHVGDSRCYQIRDRTAYLLTGDHTVASDRRRAGFMSSLQAEQSEGRHVLTRSLGPELFVKPETSSVWIKPGDIFVLCTDGLHGALEQEDLVRVTSQSKAADEIARELVASAVEADGLDNATAQIIRIVSTDPVAMYRGRRYAIR